MIVRKYGGPKRAEWFHAEENASRVAVSVLACRHEVSINVEIDGQRHCAYVKLRTLATALAKMSDESET